MARRPVKLKGERIVLRNLDNATDALQTKGAVAAVVSGALIIANDAKRRARVRTGNMRRSIHVGGHGDRTPDFQPSAGVSELPPPEKGFRGVKAFVGTNVRYAPYQEFGTSKMAAHPFMRPAMDENRAAVKKEMGTVLNQFLDQAVP